MMNILFVDDESYVLNGLERRLFRKNAEWSIFFVDSAEEAMNVMSSHNIDVIISDMVMPGINGIELLDYVAENFPSTVRIILSGDTLGTSAAKTIPIAHQYLRKPVDIDDLSNIINDVMEMKRMKLPQEYLVQAAENFGVPSLTSLHESMLTEILKPQPSIKKIASMLEKDIAMTAKILQIVNSPFFGLPHRVQSVKQAAALLGLNTLKSLILFATTFISCKLNSRQIVAAQSLWERSLSVAKLAREICTASNANEEESELAFSAGILQDIGIIFFIKDSEVYKNIEKNVAKHENNILEAECNAAGVSHVDLGAYYLGIRGLEKQIVRIVEYHHNPMAYGKDKYFTALLALHIANCVIPAPYNSIYSAPDRECLQGMHLDQELERLIKQYAH